MRRLPLAAATWLLLGAGSAAAQPRIVGGSAAPAGAFPYVANIAISGAFGCTGTLIAPTWVMTAGHRRRRTRTVAYANCRRASRTAAAPA